MTVDESYAIINQKITAVNSLYFAHLVATVLGPFFGVLYDAENSREIEYSIVYGTLKYDCNIATTKWANYDQERSFAVGRVRPGIDKIPARLKLVINQGGNHLQEH